jgi:hypothetical protein
LKKADLEELDMPIEGLAVVQVEHVDPEEDMLAQDLSIAEARSGFSDILSRAAYGDRRFILDRRGRLIAVIPNAS